MTLPDRLRRRPPASLSAARAVAHRAVQLPARSAQANLPAQADDSHSNLGWDDTLNGFVSQPIAAGPKTCHVAAGLAPLQLVLVVNGSREARVELGGLAYEDAQRWLDGTLTSIGLRPASAAHLPYELPADVAEDAAFRGAVDEELATLAAWYAWADRLLTAFTRRHASLRPGPSAVRCWPHHFDIATYVALTTGDAETAKGIGLGLSPGDESYRQPYLYINPWPHLTAAGLPELPAPGRWHSSGFVGAVATGDAIVAAPESTDFDDYVDQVFALGRRLLGA